MRSASIPQAAYRKRSAAALLTSAQRPVRKAFSKTSLANVRSPVYLCSDSAGDGVFVSQSSDCHPGKARRLPGRPKRTRSHYSGALLHLPERLQSP